jgi:hypothetical protein
VKKVIETLEQIKEFPVGLSRSTVTAMIDDIIAELITPRWIPYENMADALRYMDEAIDAVEEVTFRGRDEEKCIDTALNRIECAKGAVETMIPLPLPRWYTPEQWKERTGEPWPDNGAVYYQYTRDNKYDVWRVGTYKNILYSKRDFELSGAGTHQIICATEAGPPPDGWRP